MISESKLKRAPDLAVFCRNHPDYLAEAARIGEEDSVRRITFRASTRWASAAVALRLYGPRPIYFASIRGGPEVVYVADLVDLELDPAAHAQRTQELLAHSLNETKGEGLWEGGVKTLYIIRGCRPRPGTPVEDLRKISDGQPISRSFKYSYALVHALEEAAV
jgi:hypothetical protein